jgi:hypothetical protein
LIFGLAAGLAGSLIVGRLMRGLLYEIRRSIQRFLP